ncbi:hypothetical protein V1477_007017 [Vespula maculifrons]|uniref:Uncharacterized protein n=1 Tax=Vespula maculifrons TaxID=7453 RepID=A0ABD2CI44_VESMC
MDYETNHSTIHRTCSDVSKSGKQRRRERVEKKAGTCAHVKPIDLKRKERKEYPWNLIEKILGKILKNAAICSVILAVYEFPTYHKKQSNGAISTPDEFKPPNAKIAAPCVSAFGNRLTHSLTIQHRKLRSPLEHDRLCFRDKRRNPKLNLPQSRYLREHCGNTHANMSNATPTPLPADISQCPSILPEREKRIPSTLEVERFFKHPYKNLNPSMVLGRWSCGTRKYTG